jgi:hypothetical protein
LNEPYSGYGNVYDCGPGGCFPNCAPTRFAGGATPNPDGDLVRRIDQLEFLICQLKNTPQVPITVNNSQSINFYASGLYNTTLSAIVNISTMLGNKLSLQSNGLYSAPAAFSLTYASNLLTLVIDGISQSVTISGSGSAIPAPIFFVVGDGGTYTPAQGTNSYTNPYLISKSFTVEQRSVGTLISDGSGNAEISLSSDGFTFLNSYTFYDGDIFCIKFY